MKKSKNYTKICAKCGKEFIAHDKRQRFCTNVCRVQAYQDRIEKGIRLREIQNYLNEEKRKREEEEKEKQRLIKAEQERRNKLPRGQRFVEDMNKKLTLTREGKLITGVIGMIIDNK